MRKYNTRCMCGSGTLTTNVFEAAKKKQGVYGYLNLIITKSLPISDVAELTSSAF